ncbi:MAG: hypothetical protein B7Z75_03510 [Acidocella sp. 20-57-95]|nr:MAG: hypothetical protein B7Z75_03510 [Acidocella sp. 20-57-95]OYV59207.1 MAG: hypothetical protein B7Z71_08545 [Acidocella sp. 21-58-7]HQT64692.1 Hint domain-containing protein [Acidocella sp.]HQU04530.1 Hint domain-containing protein [Acidocella sp.]
MRPAKSEPVTPEGQTGILAANNVEFVKLTLSQLPRTLSSHATLHVGFDQSANFTVNVDAGVGVTLPMVTSPPAPPSAHALIAGAVSSYFGYGFQSSAAALQVPTAVSQFAAATGGVLNGAGLKIGVLSDSFNLLGGEAAAIAGGYLPAASMIHIIAEGAAGGRDEGMAMAELIHAIAPAAQIYFYTATNSPSDFANGITTLGSLGCNVIVDDVAWTNEPFYQNTGTITQAIENVVASGVSYFTAAGNGANNFYEGAFSPIGTGFNLPGIGTVTTDNVSNGSPYEAVSLQTNAYLDFTVQWTQPFGANSYDLGVGLFSYNAATGYTLVDNFTTGGLTSDPLLSVQKQESLTGGTYYLAFYETNSIPVLGTVATPGEFKMIFFQDSTATFTGVGAGVGSGAVYGHALATGANAVAAVAVGQTPSQGVSPPVVQTFSSYGTGKTYLDANGTLLSTPVVDHAPVFAAPDGSATSLSPPFANFFGTSAAAPNAAAVSLLVLQADARLLPTQMTYVLERSAIPTASTVTGGAGLIQAPAAVASAVTAASTPIWTAQGGSNLWSVAANWSDNVLPGSTSTASMTDGLGLFTGTYTVLDNVSSLTIGGLLVDGGTFLTAVPELTIAAADILSTGALTLGHGSIDVLGTLIDNAALTAGSAAGTLVIGSAGELTVGTTLAAETINFSGTGGQLLLDAVTTNLISGLGATISGFAYGDKIDLAGLAVTSVSSVHVSGSTVLLANASGSTLAQLNITGQTSGGLSVMADSTGGTILYDNACFCTGTRILTVRGDIAVEKLRIGDGVITKDGEVMPIKWIGHRRLDISRHPNPEKVRPIRIAANAFSDGVPWQDLWLSPDHAIAHNGYLIPAKSLMNGANITQIPQRHVTYYHIELDQHAILFAERLPAESYLDTGNRDCFDNGGTVVRLHPDFAQSLREQNSCGIFAEAGPVVASLRDRAKARFAADRTARRSGSR